MSAHDPESPRPDGSPESGSDSSEATIRQPPLPEESDRIGPYRLRQRLGEGGMGEVWLADQVEPVERRVALKIIKRGMDTREVIARFEAERQALALMDHPNIAKIHDAGSTPRGRPYFAMEYVPGVPITHYCDRHRLNTERRLELFEQVCAGVQHAHQKAVIHRDLKPGNVLVTEIDGRPVPKIIDFGVAKATARRLTEKTVFTEFGMLIGTPEYMSPEQADLTGEDVDTRTDVYSLGVMLYELLVGALPFESKELRRAGFDGIRQIIREKDPPRPSTRLSTLGERTTEIAHNRSVHARRLSRELRDDLDWITMRALEKDRARRYASAQDFAADIGRRRRNEPVSAGPPSIAYRTRKFVRRHRVGVSVSAIALIALVGFAVTMAIQARRIARERDRAEAAELVARGQLQLDADPTAAAAFAVAAAENLDHPEARELFRQAIWRSPLRRDLPKVDALNPLIPTVAPDGSSYAIGWTQKGAIAIHRLSGGSPRVYSVTAGRIVTGLDYSSDSRHLVAAAAVDSTFFEGSLDVMRVADGERLWGYSMPGWCLIWALDEPDRIIVSSSNLSHEEKQAIWYELSIASGQLRELGSTRSALADWYRGWPAVDPRGRWIADGMGNTIILRDLRDLESGSTTEVGTHGAAVVRLSFDRSGSRLASVDESGGLKIWDSSSTPIQLVREITLAEPFASDVEFDDTGQRIVVAQHDGSPHIWNLSEAPEVTPVRLVGPAKRCLGAAFLPNGSLLTCRMDWGVAHWLEPDPAYRDVALSGGELCLNGNAIVGMPAAGPARVVSLTGAATPGIPSSFDTRSMEEGLAWWRTNSNGRFLVSGSNLQISLTITDLSSHAERRLEKSDSRWIGGDEIRISPSGNRIAGRRRNLSVADLEAGWIAEMERDWSKDPALLNDGVGGCFEFVDDETILELAPGRALLWNVNSRSSQEIWSGNFEDGFVTAGGRAVLVRDATGLLRWFDPQTGQVTVLGYIPRQNILCGDIHIELGLVAVGGTWDTITVFSLEDGRRWTLPLPAGDRSYEMRFDSSGRWLAIGTPEASRIWDLPLGVPSDSAPLEELQAFLGEATDVRVVQDASSGHRLIYRTVSP